jgi:hypothetical protein
MASRLHRAILSSLLFFSFCVSAQQSDFVVSQRLRLTTSANGLNGWLEVLTDPRLTPAVLQKMWGQGDWTFVFSERDPQYALFEAKPPTNAKLRILSDDPKQPAQTLALEQPLARIKEAQLAAGRTSFLVAVDYSVGFGSYAGITTQILDVRDGQFRWASSTNIDTHDIQPIRLAKTLKSAWKLMPYRDTTQDILLVYCRPAKVAAPGHEFVTGYVRYRFNGQHWVEYQRLKSGFWESDQPFPDPAAFP